MGECLWGAKPLRACRFRVVLKFFGEFPGIACNQLPTYRFYPFLVVAEGGCGVNGREPVHETLQPAAADVPVLAERPTDRLTSSSLRHMQQLGGLHADHGSWPILFTAAPEPPRAPHHRNRKGDDADDYYCYTSSSFSISFLYATPLWLIPLLLLVQY